MPAGETKLPVQSNTGFGTGDTIVINPGGATEETNQVVGFGSLILKNPLKYAHGPGEVIRRTSAGSGATPAPTAPGAFTSPESRQKFKISVWTSPDSTTKDTRSCAVEGATVQIQRYEPVAGWVTVEGSNAIALITPGTNPVTTDSEGHTTWAVEPGFWRVVVSKDGYTTTTGQPLVVGATGIETEVFLLPGASMDTVCGVQRTDLDGASDGDSGGGFDVTTGIGAGLTIAFFGLAALIPWLVLHISGRFRKHRYAIHR